MKPKTRLDTFQILGKKITKVRLKRKLESVFRIRWRVIANISSWLQAKPREKRLITCLDAEVPASLSLAGGSLPERPIFVLEFVEQAFAFEEYHDETAS